MEDKLDNPCMAFNYEKSKLVNFRNILKIFIFLACIFQINTSHEVVLIKKGSSKKVMICYEGKDFDQNKVNANEQIIGWCGTCKYGAKQNSKF